VHAGAVTRLTGRALAFCRAAPAVLLIGVLSCSSDDPSPTSVEPPGTGSLIVTIDGLPSGLPAAVSVSGPNNYRRFIQASTDLTQLGPGTYSVSAAEIVMGDSTYAANPASQASSVPVSGTGRAAITYGVKPVPPASGINFTIAGAYLTQAVQRFDGSVPLLAGRDAYLRVFAVANLPNPARPTVRVRLFHGGALVLSQTIPAPLGGVPAAPNESALGSSWNLRVPGTLVQPGLSLLAELDADGSIAEISDADNRYPATGPSAPVQVRVLPAFNLRFVPVLQQSGALQGNVSDANKEQFLADVKAALPVGDYNADVRAPYTSNAPAVESDNGNNAWNTILSEILALRSADGSGRYYYGVVRTTYASGIAGMGYVGGASRTAVGWDRLPSAAGIMAHEVGHNMGRTHAPCGSTGGLDKSYPHAGGQIGAWGLNVSTLALKPPTTADLMGYCTPDWVSDYTWSGMLAYRESGSNNVTQAQDDGNGLLVWGRLSHRGLVLEPAFQAPARADNRPVPGPHRVELRDAGGVLLLRTGFAAQPVSDLPGAPEAHFAFVLPVPAEILPRVAEIRVAAGGVKARRAAAGRGDPGILVARRSDSRIEFRWDGSRFPMALVRDGDTGEVLSFARGGSVVLTAGSRLLDLQLSDGVRGPKGRRTVPLR